MALREVQRVTQAWVWVLILLAIVIPWGAFIYQVVLGQPFGNTPSPDWILWAALFLFGIAFPAFLISLRLVIEVRDDELYVRFTPLRTRRIPYSSIARCEARTYRPLREYGGWGLRWGGKKGWVYSLSGNRGVQLEFSDGKRLLLGSHRADEVAEAIRKRLPSRTPESAGR